MRVMRATLKSKYKKMMAGLRSNVECPVCISVPTDGHMLSCPRGHLVCNTCRVKMRAEGQENCPVCREPMGNNKSLLAMAVIENMEHECTNTGCKEMLAYEEVRKHKEELCKYRLVLCPGEECDSTFPCSSFDDHTNTCEDIDVATDTRNWFRVDDDNDTNSQWNTRIYHINNEIFGLRVGNCNGNFFFETLMLAEREKCNRFKTTISILDPNDETSFVGQFNPTPIGATHVQGSRLTIEKKSMDTIMTTENDGSRMFGIDLSISEKKVLEVID